MTRNEAFKKIPGAESFYAHVIKVEIGMPYGVADGEKVLCTPARGGVRVKFAKRGKPRLYGGITFEEHFKRVA